MNKFTSKLNIQFEEVNMQIHLQIRLLLLFIDFMSGLFELLPSTMLEFGPEYAKLHS